MKSVAITGPRQAEVRDVPQPRVRGEYALVKITVAPMCTEFKQYKDGHRQDCVGHEAVGEVAEVGERVTRLKVGDRVVAMPLYACGVCHLCAAGDYIHCENAGDPLASCESPSGTATYAQYLIKPERLLIPVPDTMSDEHASMACCGLGPTFGAMRNMNVTADDTVMVVGLGPVGLGGVINGAYRGARVIGVESNPYRAALAKELGAEAVVNPTDPDALRQVQALTGGRGGADKTVECTGLPAAQRFAMDATRRRGHVTFVGWGGRVEIDNWVPRGLTLQGSWHYNLNDAPRLMRMIERVGPQIDKLITHRFPMSRVAEAWELQLTGNCGKVLLDPWA